MNIKHIGMAITVAFGLGITSRAAESVWIGGAEGTFDVAENWDPAGVPNVKDSVAVFTNAATVTMNGAFCEIRALGGDLTINHTYRVSVVGNSQDEVVVEVADGCVLTFTIANSSIFYGNTKTTFVKSGAGRLNVPRCLGYGSDIFKDVDIRGGTLYLEANYGGLNTVDGYVHIANGATFLQGLYNELPANNAVEIDAGGTLNYNNVGNGTLRGIYGPGTVSGLGQVSYPVTLRGEARAFGSQGVFSGTMSSGAVKMMSTNGCPFVIRSPGLTYADVQTWNAYIVDAGENDTGFEKSGCGCLKFANYVACLGPVVMRAGKISVSANSGWVLGAGSFQIDRGLVSIVQNRSDFIMASASGSQMIVNGPSAIRLDSSGADLSIGPSDATSSSLVFGANGVLAFDLSGGATLENDVITVRGGLPAGSPAFAYYCYVTSGAPYTRKQGYNFLPVKTDDSNHLIVAEPDFTNEFPTKGVGAIVRKRNAEILSVPVDVVPIAALHVYGGAYVSGAGEAVLQRKIGGVEIPKGVTLKVGDGTRGIVLLNSYYYLDDYGWARVKGEGTMDFGTNHGLIVASDCYESQGKTPVIPFPAQLNCRLAGTAGVSFASPLTGDLTADANWHALNGDYMRAVQVGGDNSYTGGTRIDGMVVQPLQATSLGQDTVTVVGDTNGGGELNFTSNYVGNVFGNDLVVSGTGYSTKASAAIWGIRAAVSSYNKKIRLTGAITLAGDATIATTGENGQIILEGPVTGKGTLRLTAGKLVVKKEAIAAYEAGKIVAESGAEIDVRPPMGLMLIVR